MARRHRIAFILIALSAPLVACSSDPATSGTDPNSPGAASSFGEPGSPGKVDRTIAITQLDAPSFDPDSIIVKQGETIRFEITNEGSDDHEFVLGDATTQDSHGSTMEEMEGMAGMTVEEDNVVSAEPGATETLIWTFTDQGTVLYGCHVNSHYDAGMVGTITVES